MTVIVSEQQAKSIINEIQSNLDIQKAMGRLRFYEKAYELKIKYSVIETIDGLFKGLVIHSIEQPYAFCMKYGHIFDKTNVRDYFIDEQLKVTCLTCGHEYIVDKNTGKVDCEPIGELSYPLNR
jgi:hypothetical protein